MMPRPLPPVRRLRLNARRACQPALPQSPRLRRTRVARFHRAARDERRPIRRPFRSFRAFLPRCFKIFHWRLILHQVKEAPLAASSGASASHCAGAAAALPLQRSADSASDAARREAVAERCLTRFSAARVRRMPARPMNAEVATRILSFLQARLPCLIISSSRHGTAHSYSVC